MATVSFYHDTRRAKKDGTYPIKLSIRHNGKFLINTDFSALKESWSGSEYNRSENNYKTKNVVIRSLINKVENYLLQLDSSGKLRTMSDKSLMDNIKKILSNKILKNRNFISYIDEFIQTKTNNGTINQYIGTKNKIKLFDPDCTFDTITKKWLDLFNKWLADSNMKINSRATHLRNIRAVFNYAIDNEETTLYPFRKYRIEREKTRKRALKPEQLALLRDYKGEDYQRIHQDMFMLMFYLMGINGVDLFYTKKIIDGRIEYKRAKTGRLYSIKVEPEAMEIINKYRGKKYLLNAIENHRGKYLNFMNIMNRALQLVGDFEVEKKTYKKLRNPLFPDVTSYWARHTWATIAASLDIPKETISAALGHEIGSRITSIYIDFDQSKVDEANRKVIDYLNGFVSTNLK